MMLDSNDCVGVLAASNSAIRHALEELGIDYCCSGNRSLADAAAAEGLPIQGVIAAIERGSVATEPLNRSWFDRSLRDVITHLRHQHRSVSLEVLARTAVLFELVADERLLDRDLLDPIRQTFHKFVNDITPHTEREENILFPVIEAIEDSWTHGSDLPPRFEGGLRAAIAPNFLEHERINTELRDLRSGRAVLACIDDRLCRQLAWNLEQLERHVHETMNVENFVLYPRAIALEDQLVEQPVAAGA